VGVSVGVCKGRDVRVSIGVGRGVNSGSACGTELGLVLGFVWASALALAFALTSASSYGESVHMAKQRMVTTYLGNFLLLIITKK